MAMLPAARNIELVARTGVTPTRLATARCFRPWPVTLEAQGTGTLLHTGRSWTAAIRQEYDVLGKYDLFDSQRFDAYISRSLGQRRGWYGSLAEGCQGQVSTIEVR